MDFGLGAARTALSAQSEALSAWGDNIANATTPGFQADVPSFSDALRQNLPAGAWSRALTGNPGAAVGVGAGTVLSVQQSVSDNGVTATGNPLDIAVNGPGYLVVETGGQRLLTRDGSLQLDAKGNLVDASGANVLNARLQPIRVPPGSQIQIQNGNVTVGGAVVDQLAVAQVANPGGLVRVGGSHLTATAQSGAPRVAVPASGQLLSGYLNQSAASLTQAMAGLIASQSSFDLAAKVAQQAAQLASLTAQIG